jgi:hypothetical protein
MRGITTTLAIGMLIGSLVTQATLRAEQSEPAAKGPKLTLNAVEAQVTGLQTQVNSLESELHSLETKVTSQPMFAVVNADGGLSRGSGNVVKTARLGSNLYRVTFNKDVSNCAYNATVGGSQIGNFPIGFTFVAPGDDNASVFVLTLDFGGNQVARPFYLSVICE